MKHALEAIGAYILLGIFAILPCRVASAFGGFLGRVIGPHLGVSRRALKHIKQAFPDWDDKTRNAILRGHWDNLGRVVAEYPHLKTIARHHIHVENADELQKIFDQDKGAVFIGAHQGNWELNAAAMLLQFDTALDITYRAPNNPYIARMIDNFRSLKGRLQAFPKSRESGRKIMNTVKGGGFLGILIDQKYNEGIDIPFFGHPAMTNPIAFQLAQKYECPLVPVQNIRLGGARFKIIVHPPIPTHENDGSPRPLETMMKEAHFMLENWIRAHPDQWIWMHRRWKDNDS